MNKNETNKAIRIDLNLHEKLKVMASDSEVSMYNLVNIAVAKMIGVEYRRPVDKARYMRIIESIDHNPFMVQHVFKRINGRKSEPLIYRQDCAVDLYLLSLSSHVNRNKGGFYSNENPDLI